MLAGLTLGFFLWESLAAPRLGAFFSEIAFLALPLLGAAATYFLWLEYARYFSARAGVTFAKSLRHDAITWAPFLLLWATYVVPPNLATGSRMLVLAAMLSAILKVLIAARFNQTVREVLLDFVATRAAIIVIAELAAVIIGQRPGQHVSESSQLLLAVWGRWDAVHYLNIATHGYQGTEMAFFPLYPMMIRARASEDSEERKEHERETGHAHQARCRHRDEDRERHIGDIGRAQSLPAEDQHRDHERGETQLERLVRNRRA